MKTIHLFTFLAIGLFLSGCAHRSGDSISMIAPQAYITEGNAPVSLFPSDQAVLSDEAVAKILSSKLVLPPKAKIALMTFSDTRFGSRYYGSYYWRDEQYQKLQQKQVEVVSDTLMASGQVAEVTLLPSLLIPKQMTIPVLREAALRTQADLLLIYRVTSDTYTRFRMFAKDQVKAYSTCEIIVLDTRTGLIPFARVINTEKLEKVQPSDFNLDEAMRRTEQDSAIEALGTAAKQLEAYIKDTPKRNG